MTTTSRTAEAALAALIILEVTMLGALYAGVEPHPPAIVPIAGMAPLMAAGIAAAAAAMILGPLESRAGRALTIVAVLVGLLSFGPHKVLDPAFALVWPAVLVGLTACVTLVVSVALRIRIGRPVLL